MSKLNKKKELMKAYIKKRAEITAKIKELQSQIETLESQDLRDSLRELNLNAAEAMRLLAQLKKEQEEKVDDILTDENYQNDFDDDQSLNVLEATAITGGKSA